MNDEDLKMVNGVLASYDLVVTEDTPLTVEYMAFNCLHNPEHKDIQTLSGHDLDGDVGYVFKIGDKRFTVPGKTTVILLAALKYVPKERECAILF